MKIPLVVLVYYNHGDIQQTLESIFDDRLDIYVIENPTENTPLIKEMCLNYLEEGKIKKYILFDKNIAQNAVSTVFYDGLIDLSTKYIITTDGDLIPDKGWLDEQLKILENNQDLFVIGQDLKLDNLPLYNFPEARSWIRPTIDRGEYLEGDCGNHLLLFRTNEFQDMIKWMKQCNKSFLDSNMQEYCKNQGKKWGRTKETKSWHWTWDLYQDINHPYTKYKVEYKNIWQNTESSKYEVYE